MALPPQPVAPLPAAGAPRMRATLESMLLEAWARRGLMAWLLWPVSLLYAIAVSVRRWQYRQGLRATCRVNAFVIVVGNVVAGGAGKTPVVIALVKHLMSRGMNVGVLSRGYGRTTRDCREVFAESLAQEVGDEPALIRRTTRAPVFVAPRRADAAQALLAKYPATQVLVCDDGLQHHALHRDLEICVFDDRGIGNGFLLPAGPLREPWPRKTQVSPDASGVQGSMVQPQIEPVVLHTGVRPALREGFVARRELADHAVGSDGRAVALSDLRHTPVVALAAIAQPDQFFAMLRTKGLTLAGTLALPDHYDFDSWVCPFHVGQLVICTEKDATKLWRSHPQILAVPLIVTLEPDFLAAIDQAVTKLSSPHGYTTA